MPPYSAIFRRGCAYHSGTSGTQGGGTYDSNGNSCGQISAEDKIYIGAAAGLCGTGLLVLAAVFAIRKYKGLRRDSQSNGLDRPMSMMGNPLLTSVRDTWHDNSSYIERPLISPVLSSHENQATDSSSSSTHSNHSLYSPVSENFHFPILSADGQLLPPVPASARRSWVEASEVDIGARPLPSPPLEAPPTAATLHKTSQGFHLPAQSESAGEHRAIVGLYAEVPYDLRDGAERYQARMRPNVAASPTLSKNHSGAGFAAQQATIYRSLSAEGDDDYSIYEYDSEDRHGHY